MAAKVAVLGYGTVGSGVVKILWDNNSHVSRRAGEAVELKYVLDLRDFPGDPVEKVLVHDFDTIVNDPEIQQGAGGSKGSGAHFHCKGT